MLHFGCRKYTAERGRCAEEYNIINHSYLSRLLLACFCYCHRCCCCTWSPPHDRLLARCAIPAIAVYEHVDWPKGRSRQTGKQTSK